MNKSLRETTCVFKVQSRKHGEDNDVASEGGIEDSFVEREVHAEEGSHAL